MSRFWPIYAILIAAWAVLIGVFTMAPPARSHEWYTGKRDPNGTSCCGGADCRHIELGSVREIEGGFIVTLTKAEMARIRPGLATKEAVVSSQYGPMTVSENPYFKAVTWGISEFIPYSQAQPAEDGNYSVCLGYSPKQMQGSGPMRWITCFFYPTNT